MRLWRGMAAAVVVRRQRAAHDEKWKARFRRCQGAVLALAREREEKMEWAL